MSATVPVNANTSAVVLAAGKGTRMGSDLAKVLHPLAGRPLIAHVLDTCRALGVGQAVVVVGWQRERVEEAVRPWKPTCVLQDRQLGTGHAVLATQSSVRGEVVLVLCGDCPLTPPALLQEVLTKHARTGASCTGVAARMQDPTGYGRMITDAASRLVGIVEHKDASPDQRAIDLVNSGIYAFRRADLFRCLAKVRPQNAQGEYYLTDVVAMLVAEGEPVELVVTDDVASVLGVNTPADLATAERLRAGRAP
ncbi:MAG: NTP transferase domain-containing protein [Planctomycetes bacterium]|nr:NTP transferase domain-containing protein [Planctomycetota bacterium]